MNARESQRGCQTAQNEQASRPPSAGKHALGRLSLLTLFCSLAAIASCSHKPAEYLIGAAGPLELPYGIQNRRGIDLAIEEINRGGGINGVPLHADMRDDHASGVEAAQIAGSFVANPAILAVVGHAGSGAEVSAAHVYHGGALPAVATTPSSPDLTGISPWVFRMISSDSVNGVTLARFAYSLTDSLHRTVRAAVLYHNDAYGRGLSDAFLHSFRGLVVSSDPIGPDTDLEPYITFFAKQKIDLVFVASDEDIGIGVLRAARKGKLRAMFLGGDGWQGVVADSASDGAYIGTPFTAQSGDSAARRFTLAFRAKYGQIPDAHAALAYDATRLVARAIASGASRKGVRQYLASLSKTSAFQSLSGPLWFSATDPVGDTFVVTRVDDGAMMPVTAR